MAPRFVVVSGPPASGKSTVAPALAAGLALPLIAKDTIKDALLAVLPAPDVDASRALGRAAIGAMAAVAAASPVGGVLESTFHRSLAVGLLRSLPGPIVEVFCRCDRELAWRRYSERAGTRHAGHFDSLRAPAELWNDEVAEPVAGGWPVVEVATTAPVDVGDVIRRVRAAFPRD